MVPVHWLPLEEGEVVSWSWQLRQAMEMIAPDTVPGHGIDDRCGLRDRVVHYARYAHKSAAKLRERPRIHYKIEKSERQSRPC